MAVVVAMTTINQPAIIAGKPLIFSQQQRPAPASMKVSL